MYFDALFYIRTGDNNFDLYFDIIINVESSTIIDVEFSTVIDINNILRLDNNDDNIQFTSGDNDVKFSDYITKISYTPSHIIKHGSVLYLILLQICLYDQRYILLMYRNVFSFDCVTKIPYAPVHIIGHGSVLYLIFMQILLYDQQNVLLYDAVTTIVMMKAYDMT